MADKAINIGDYMNNEQYTVDGFMFNNPADYADAKDEWNTVEYIKKNSDLTKEVIVYKLFNRLNERKTFKTVVGLKFHNELRETLLKTGNYKEGDLKHILVPGKNENQRPDTLVSDISKKTDSTNIRNARIINIFLVLTILAMFAINLYT